MEFLVVGIFISACAAIVWATSPSKEDRKKMGLKRCPMTVEAAESVELDNKAAMGEPQDTAKSDVIDILGNDITVSTIEESEKDPLEGGEEIPGLD